MPREPWTVDTELSRLGEAIQAQQKPTPETQPEPGNAEANTPRQHIHGSRNIQVGGDLNLLAPPPVDPAHPEAFRCPQCRQLTYRRSDACTNCRFPLHRYRINQERETKRRRLIMILLGCGIPGLLLLTAGVKDLIGAERLLALGVGGGLLLAALIAVLQLSQMEIVS